MKHRAKVCLVKTLLIAAAAVLAWPTLAATGQTDSWDRFRLLAERNMFLRDRRSPPSQRPAPTAPATVAAEPDRHIMLTGIAKHGSEYVAFLEDTRTGETIRVRVGEAAGKGKLTAITLDGVDYECGGTMARIEIGSSLAGSTPSLGKAERDPEDTSGPSRVAPPGDARDADTADILERMRRRREEELKK